MVIGAVHPLRSADSETAPPLAMVEPGVVGLLMSCPKDSLFCRVGIGNRVGWIKRTDFWGVHRSEFLN
ncbi:MAG: hypothetical protein HQL37_11450 [Alphaproteobacteria bacterium]|nr:hypothetical protein [Alphaproteobacteria bacterium]